MKFLASFGRNAFSLDVVPVTNSQYVSNRLAKKEEVSAHDRLSAFHDPFGPHHNATFEKAKALCEGGTVVFA